MPRSSDSTGFPTVFLIIVMCGSVGCDTSVEGWAIAFDEGMTLFSSLDQCEGLARDPSSMIRVEAIRVDDGVILGDRLYRVPADCLHVRLTGRKASESNREEGREDVTAFKTMTRFERFDPNISEWIEVAHTR